MYFDPKSQMIFCLRTLGGSSILMCDDDNCKLPPSQHIGMELCNQWLLDGTLEAFLSNHDMVRLVSDMPSEEGPKL